ncbi:hypothetical protein [Anaerobaca lacustris]|uniref:Uncharacterized protein n=1 Tax=Anaerobaca lacustris TaxID=3044600 RepID=A0AAW6TVM1_9BACT|nr:hypothetical protein [Sedimentisphaerales bacterium M17dextr]
MSDVRKFLGVAWMIALLVGTSCTRAPQGDQLASSEESHSIDADNTSIAPAMADTVPSDGKPDAGQEDGEFIQAAPPSEVDINSGDVRGSRYRADGSAQYGVYESRLSKEVRRLGIPIPDRRDWWPIAAPSIGVGGMRVTYVYENLLPTAHRLLDVLGKVNAPDSERRDIIERLMAGLQTERPPVAIANARALIVEVVDRYGLESPFLPHHTEHLRQRRNGQVGEP